jgi:hypothetical protein
MSRRQHLALDQFLLGIGRLERFFRVKLHPTVRDSYHDAVKDAKPEQWEKVVEYATMVWKKAGLPRPADLREWMGLPEPLSPAEDEGFRPGTIGGLTPLEIKERARRGEDLPFPEPWRDELEKTIYLDQAYADRTPEELTLPERLAWIRKYAERASEQYERCKPKESA